MYEVLFMLIPEGKTATWASEAHPQQDSKQIKREDVRA